MNALQEEVLQNPCDIATATAATSPSATNSYVYTCRMCRRVLFTQRDIMPHDADPNSRGNKGFTRRGGGRNSQQTPMTVGSEVCTSLFLDPDILPWVAEKSREVHTASGGADVMPDTIYCPNRNCNAKIGTQSWVGSQCSCGVWVAPAFKIHNRVVDKVPAA